jgi:exopolysaccharide biosynthesis polyprenyl glycosylphosphotransferase
LNRRKLVIEYLLLDFFSSGIAWALFFIIRKAYIEPAKFGYKIPIELDIKFYMGIVLIPLYWITLYFLSGSYGEIYRKSRLREFVNTIVISFLGTVALFFVLLLDDEVRSYEVYRSTFLILLLLQFTIISISRITFLTIIKARIRRREISFNTLILGNNEKALTLFQEMEEEKYSQGYKFVGYVSITENSSDLLEGHLKKMGTFHDLDKIISDNKIEVIILSVDSSEHEELNKIISSLEGQSVNIKIIPDMYDLISGKVKMNYIFGSALIDISPDIMPAWQKNIKRIVDIIISTIVLLVFSPFLLMISLIIYSTSKGPVFYKQERLGKNGKPFMILKFRTMYMNAEKDGPQLSSENDPRITPFGKFLRKYRFDELIQFWNVLKGDMTIVSPRPERKYFFDQIVQKAPQYKHLLKVKPGITSWGQIKYGYAENVDEMIERMKYDILYIENMSLAMDFKIMFYTILIMLKGQGK